MHEPDATSTDHQLFLKGNIMSEQNTIKAEELNVEGQDLDLFSDELDVRNNPKAAISTIFCASTEATVCTFSSACSSAAEVA